MKIEYEKSRQVIHFAALEVGTVFRDSETDLIYMKTDYIDSKDGDEINSVDLENGEFICFCNETIVYPVNATLYVKE